MLTVNRKRFFAAPAVRVKVCICMGSGDVWKWYYLMPQGGILEIGPVSEFTPAEAVSAALRMYTSRLGKARNRMLIPSSKIRA